MNAPTPLFRKEVLEHRAERLHGDVHLAVPVSWQVIGFTLLAALAAAILFLATASYARIESVTGAIVLDRGVAPIVPSRPGVITAIHVREGQRVDAGAPLADVRAEEDLAGGDTMPERVRAALLEQDERLSAQTQAVLAAAAAERARLAEQMAGAAQELVSLDAQIAAQKQLVGQSENEVREVAQVVARGFISRRDRDARESQLLLRRQQLAQLQQTRAARAADLAQARRAVAQTEASSQAQAAGVQSSRAGLAQQLAESEAARGYTLTSPVAGLVTALTARPGQPANGEQPLMVLMPTGAKPYAELSVPTAAAGFLAPGQEVRLAVDAFSYERFGTVPARIVSISSVAVPRAGPNGMPVPVYIVAVELGQNHVQAFGRPQPMLPGMTLTARIVTDRRSLLQWLFEPLFALRQR